MHRRIIGPKRTTGPGPPSDYPRLVAHRRPITVRYPSGQQIARIVTGDSFRVQHSFQKHFGLGDVAQVDTIEVKWLDGTVHELQDPDVDRYHRIQ